MWLVTGQADSPLAELAEEVVVCTPEVEQSWCHTASYTCAVAAIAALRGEDVAWLPAAVEEALAFSEPVPEQAKILVAGAGRDWPTAQEAVLKLREGAWVSAGAHHTEQLLHGHLAAIDETVRAYVLEGEGRAAERARDAAAALRELGCETTLVPTRAPGRRHRALPPADARDRRGAGHRPRPDPPRRRALGSGAGRVHLVEAALGWRRAAVRARLLLPRLRRPRRRGHGDGRAARGHRQGGRPARPDHAAALLTWLRHWGCRQFAVADEELSRASLADWWRAWGRKLPPPKRTVDALDDRALDAIAGAYDDLRGRQASWQRRADGNVAKTFGATGTAKALYAIRPNACPPWDEPIRRTLGLPETGEGYRRHLVRVQAEIAEAAADLGPGGERRRAPRGDRPSGDEPREARRRARLGALHARHRAAAAGAPRPLGRLGRG